MKRASLTHHEVVAMVKKLYGLSVTHYAELNSYDDVNLRIYVKNSTHGMSVSPDGYVLKILNSIDSEKVKFVDAMHGAIFQCYAAGIVTPRPLPNLDGEYFSLEELSTSSNTSEERCKFLVRLFEYIPGELLQGKPCSPQLCYSVGQTAARIDKALMGFYHPGYDNHARHWCLSRVEFLLDKVDAVETEADRDLIREVVAEFKANVANNYHNLQQGVIHGDLNDQNLLVKPVSNIDVNQVTVSESVSGSKQITSAEVFSVLGVLDFGDSVYKYHVFDIAIAIMYMMIQNDSMDLVDVGGVTLSGYLSEQHLSSTDLSVLKDCVCGRFAQSLVYGAYQHKMDPSNTYVLQTASKGWPLLRQLWQMPKKSLYTKWQMILNTYRVDVKFDI